MAAVCNLLLTHIPHTTHKIDVFQNKKQELKTLLIVKNCCFMQFLIERLMSVRGIDKLANNSIVFDE